MKKIKRVVYPFICIKLFSNHLIYVYKEELCLLSANIHLNKDLSNIHNSQQSKLIEFCIF